MTHVGFERLADFDSVTLMNDTCFGPLWDMSDLVEDLNNDRVLTFGG